MTLNSLAKWHRLFFALLLCCFAFSCDRATALVLVTFPDSTAPPIHSEVVHTPGSRELGLMYRKQLADDQGMLFVFPVEKRLSFWMKNTYLPLDIIFIDRNLKVVSISANAIPMTETPRESTGPAQYVLEVKAGLADRWGLKPGVSMVIEGTLPTPQ